MRDIVKQARAVTHAACKPLVNELADMIERLQAKIKRYEDEQCAACRAYREIEARRALETKP